MLSSVVGIFSIDKTVHTDFVESSMGQPEKCI